MDLSWLIIPCLIGIVQCQYDSFMLSEHNRYRRMEGAANMQKLEWSTTLRNAALRFAQTCTQGHQNGPEGYGENLYMYTKSNYPEKDLITKGIKAWYDEKQIWRWGMGFTSATGHYTQLVWAKTKQVGCATHICSAQGMFRSSYLYLACFYSPAGNFNNENPYIRGTACSKCNSGQQCDNGLCSGSSSGGSGSTNTNNGGNTGSTGNTNTNNGWNTGNNGAYPGKGWNYWWWKRGQNIDRKIKSDLISDQQSDETTAKRLAEMLESLREEPIQSEYTEQIL